jgi:tetratricopeptide (TPR) repeat protein
MNALLAIVLSAVVSRQDGATPPPALPLPAPARLSPVELEYWNSPEFRRQFAQSYLAETDIEPKVTEDERKVMQKVLVAISQDKMDEARKLLSEGRTPASSAVFDFTLANLAFQADDLANAAAEYEASVGKFPKFRRAWKNLSLIHVRNGDFAKAAPALSKVIELGGGDGLTYGLLGFAYSNLENNLAAESAYRMAILLDPATKDWRMGLARSFFKQERFADAIALTGALLRETPDAADLWLLQANAFLGSGQPMRAAENYEIVDRLGKSTPESLNMLADIYVNDELYEPAARRYLEALDLDAKADGERPLKAAQVLVGRGALDEAKALLDGVETRRGASFGESRRSEFLKLRARIAAATQASDEEARLLAEIVTLDPLDGEALLLLGQYHARNGDPERAIFHYERAASLEKFEPDAKVRHAQLLVQQGKYAEAIPLLRAAQQLRYRDNIQAYLEQVERIAKTR